MGSSTLSSATMSRILTFLVVAFFGLAACKTEDRLPLSQGDCPHGWLDASSVQMGCLQFNGTKTMTWTAASTHCKQSYTDGDATMVEILNTEQMDTIIVDLEFLE